MSTLKVDTMEDLSAGESVDTAYLIHGTAKALLNYDHAGATINKSLNVSSVTDISTGKITVNFISSFADTHYCVSQSSDDSGSNYDWAITVVDVNGGQKTVSLYDLTCVQYNASAVMDSNYYNIMHGGLA